MTNQPPSLPVAKAPKSDYRNMSEAQLEIERLMLTVDLYEEENYGQRKTIEAQEEVTESFKESNFQLSAELGEAQAELASYKAENAQLWDSLKEAVEDLDSNRAELLDIKALVPTDFGSDEDEDGNDVGVQLDVDFEEEEGQLGDYGVGVQLDVDFEDEEQCPDCSACKGHCK